ncbi:MAG: metallophosphoesterase family protein [Blastocatellia bacterium]|nr:metallophosphoesterase family protein [Blastocatellia bacterium]
MSTIELVRAWLFITVVGFVFAVAALAILRRPAAWLAKRAVKPLSKFQRVMLVLAGIGVLCMAYAHWIEPYWIEVTRVSLSSPKLATASRLIRVAHISDLHCDPVERVENKMLSLIANEKPDLIVFTGDTMNRADSLPVLKQTLTQLAQIAPTFVVKGNWDVWYYPMLDLFGGTGVKELNNEAVKFDVAGTSLWLVGMPVSETLNYEKAFASVPPNAFTLMLYHYPDEIEAAQTRYVDLYCAGHTHGGQIALPLYGALITFSKFDKKYEAGFFHEGPTWLYVNRGMGCEGTPHFRFFARPEVTMIELGKNGEQ